jgi:hypothetical protein
VRWRELDCDFEVGGVTYGAMGDVYVRTEEKDVGPEGFRRTLLAEVPVEATVENLQICNAGGERLSLPAAEVVQVATEVLQDLACSKTWELA